jgi:hypothetical protein
MNKRLFFIAAFICNVKHIRWANIPFYPKPFGYENMKLSDKNGVHLPSDVPVFSLFLEAILLFQPYCIHISTSIILGVDIRVV